MYDAYKRKDLEAILGLLETEIEIYQTTAVPWGGRYRGREGTQQFLGRLMAHVDSVVEIEELFDAGERVVEIGRSLGWVKGTNRKFDVRGPRLGAAGRKDCVAPVASRHSRDVGSARTIKLWTRKPCAQCGRVGSRRWRVS
jgi:SnoaL-like domain